LNIKKRNKSKEPGEKPMENRNRKLFLLKTASSVFGLAFLLLCAAAARILSEAGAAVSPSPAASGAAVIGKADGPTAILVSSSSAPSLPILLYVGMAILLVLLAVSQLWVYRMKRQMKK
jgi:Na+-transporting methylmalonyl-CoA/oxaloacetate decarboxylase beta subunit